MLKGTAISISGKGGVGKTTIAALLLRALSGAGRSILMVDADPATNLPDAIGTHVESTVGMVATRLKKEAQSDELPPSMTKRELLELWIMETLTETQTFDLLVMGRTEGEGCYCMVNNLLTNILDVLISNYDLVIMDMEPGLEHLSRRTDHDVDIMFIVTEPSKMSFTTAERIRDLTKEVHIDVRRLLLIGNRFPSGTEKVVIEQSRSTGMELAGVVPVDPNIVSYSVEGKSLLELPDNSPSVIALDEIVKRVGIK